MCRKLVFRMQHATLSRAFDGGGEGERGIEVERGRAKSCYSHRGRAARRYCASHSSEPTPTGIPPNTPPMFALSARTRARARTHTHKHKHTHNPVQGTAASIAGRSSPKGTATQGKPFMVLSKPAALRSPDTTTTCAIECSIHSRVTAIV